MRRKNDLEGVGPGLVRVGYDFERAGRELVRVGSPFVRAGRAFCGLDLRSCGSEVRSCGLDVGSCGWDFLSSISGTGSRFEAETPQCEWVPDGLTLWRLPDRARAAFRPV